MRAGAVLLVVALAAALSVDVVKTGFGIKGDEATYVSMALSLAYDHDLTYERRDLDRFYGLYRSGPDGIFLKKGKQLKIRVNGEPPFVHEIKTPDRQADRLYLRRRSCIRSWRQWFLVLRVAVRRLRVWLQVPRGAPWRQPRR
jgi:hypothetical protein